MYIHHIERSSTLKGNMCILNVFYMCISTVAKIYLVFLLFNEMHQLSKKFVSVRF